LRELLLSLFTPPTFIRIMTVRTKIEIRREIKGRSRNQKICILMDMSCWFRDYKFMIIQEELIDF
jgi:hypothetical protein